MLPWSQVSLQVIIRSDCVSEVESTEDGNRSMELVDKCYLVRSCSGLLPYFNLGYVLLDVTRFVICICKGRN